MLHVAGHTPEADLPLAPDADEVLVTPIDLARVWHDLNPGPEAVDLVAFGSPHFSHEECRRLAALLDARPVAIPTIITTARAVRDAARADGTLTRLQLSGVQVVTDLCWCSITEPVFPPSARALMTNSGKYAHYAPGLHGRAVRFGSLADCVAAATSGRAPRFCAWLE
jgi:predicted aconitase